MTPTQLYDLLDQEGVDYEIVEIFEGSRWLKIEVEETDKVSDSSGEANG
jgi:hypothetical protein